MAITIGCRGCGRTYTVNESFAGQTVVCPNCKGPIEVAGPGQSAPPESSAPSSTNCGRCGMPVPDDAYACEACGMPVVGRIKPDEEALQAERNTMVRSLVLAVVGLAVLGGLVYVMLRVITKATSPDQKAPTTTTNVATKKELPPEPVPTQIEVEAKLKEKLASVVTRSKAAADKTRAKIEEGGVLPTTRQEWAITELELVDSEVVPRKDDVLSPYSGTATFKRMVCEYDEETGKYGLPVTSTVTRKYSFYLVTGWAQP